MKHDFRQKPRGHLGVIPTFRCNVVCRHCQHACGPQRKEVMSLALFRQVVRQGIEAGFETICISGGEPFLLPGHLRRAAAICRQHGAALIVQSNGFWGCSQASASEALRDMEGLTQLGLSVDAAHLEYIDIDCVLRAFAAARDAGVSGLSLSVSYQEESEFALLKEQFEGRFPGIAVAGWPVTPIGRAAEHPSLYASAPTFSWDCLQRCCPAQLAFAPIVLPTGTLHGCYHTVMALEGDDPLILGDLREQRVADVLDKAQNPVFSFVSAFSGGGLGYLLSGSPWEGLLSCDYGSVCHFCYAVFSDPRVRDHIRSLLTAPELQQRLFHAQGLNGEDSGQACVCDETKRERSVQVCNGPNCSKGKKNYAPMHYLANQLAETGMASDVSLQTTSCMNSCSAGPNFRMGADGTLWPQMDKARVDRLIDELSDSG